MSDFCAGATFPDKAVPTFRPCLGSLAEKGRSLTFRILKCLSLALGQGEDYLGNMQTAHDAIKLS